MFYIGIDPGKKGGIAVISDDGEEPMVFPYSDQTLQRVTETYYGKAIVENVHAMPGQGVTSMFTFGKEFGYICGTLEARGIPYELVQPRTWQKEFGITSKEVSVAVAKRLFPNLSLKTAPTSKKDSDGLADALLMAVFGLRKGRI